MLRRNDSDRSDPAVRIDHFPVPAQIGHLDCFPVQEFRLDGIDLIEGPGGNAEAFSAKLILNIAVSVSDRFLLTKDDGCGPVIDIEDDRGDFRMLRAQGLHKIIFARKHGRSQDKHHHELSGCMRAADQHMAKKPLPGILIVAGNAECFGKFHHGIRNLPRFAVFDQTAPHRYDPVRSLRIDAGKMLPGSSAPLIGTGAVHLVPVIIRILHADDPVRFYIRSEKLSDPFLLFRQSVRIGLAYGDAASAVFFVWTIHVLYRAHDSSPSFIFRVPETVMDSPEPFSCLPSIPLLA